MADVLRDSRSAPRIGVDLGVDLACRGDLWQARARDLSPGGCLLVTARPYPVGADVVVLVRSERVRESLLANGTIAWGRPNQVGVQFAAGQDGVEPWLRRIVEPGPAAQAPARAMPRELRPDDLLTSGPTLRTLGEQRSPAETAVLRALRYRTACSVHDLSAIVGLPADQLACALFTLIGDGLLSVGRAR